MAGFGRTLLNLWLAFLVVFEVITIYRLQWEPLHYVFPLYFKEMTRPFVNIVQLMACFLAVTRGSCILSPDSVGAWRTCALIHVVEAMYFYNVAFYTERTLSFKRFELAVHGQPALIFGVIVFNALLFTVVYLTRKGTQPAAAAAAPAAVSAAGGKTKTN